MAIFALVISVDNAVAQSWIQLAPSPPLPSPRLYDPAVYNSNSNRLIFFGGYPIHTSGDQNPQNDVWILSGANGIGTASWTQVIPSFVPGSPAPRYGHSAIYDPVTNRMTIFGGQDAFRQFNDVWVLSYADGTSGTPTWQQISPTGLAPPPRADHEAIYDPASNRMIVFGGLGTTHCPCALLNDVWVLTNANGNDSTTPTWIQLTPSGAMPQARSNFVLGYDSTSNRLIVFAGVTGSALDTVLGDVWVLTNANGLGGTPTWQQLSPGGTQLALAYASGAYDSVTNELIVFGGLAQVTSGSSSSNTTWILSNANGLGGPAQWQQLSVAGTLPIGHDSGTTVYDPSTNRLIAFAGEQHASFLTLNDTWVLTNANGIVGSQVSITEILPNHGGNAGSVTVNVTGAGFQNGTTVRLTGLGPDIIASSVSVANASSLTATFNLVGATPGVRDVVVTNPDNSTATLTGAFAVQQGGSPQLSAGIIGRQVFRVGAPQTFYISYANSGTVDALGTQVIVTFPTRVGSTLGFGNEVGVVSTGTIGTNTVITVNLGRVPASSISFLPVVLTGTSSQPFSIQTSIRGH